MIDFIIIAITLLLFFGCVTEMKKIIERTMNAKISYFGFFKLMAAMFVIMITFKNEK